MKVPVHRETISPRKPQLHGSFSWSASIYCSFEGRPAPIGNSLRDRNIQYGTASERSFLSHPCLDITNVSIFSITAHEYRAMMAAVITHLCLCFGFFEQMIYTYFPPFRLTLLHPLHSFFTELRTFMPRTCSAVRLRDDAGDLDAVLPIRRRWKAVVRVDRAEVVLMLRCAGDAW